MLWTSRQLSSSFGFQARQTRLHPTAPRSCSSSRYPPHSEQEVLAKAGTGSLCRRLLSFHCVKNTLCPLRKLLGHRQSFRRAFPARQSLLLSISFHVAHLPS